ncbi:ABC transporter permease [Paenibacillus sp. FSL R7-0302]|uniref:ABC transporter permease n=1 Tax=Paenibacillus sp. FSL R7-0302 TaxID=2921681 RepID=UPI0030FB339C
MKLVKRILLLLSALLILVVSFYYIKLYVKDNGKIILKMDVNSEVSDEYQVFYSSSPEGWDETKSVKKIYDQNTKWQTLKFDIPNGYFFIRVDIGNEKGSISVKNIYLSGNSNVKIDLFNSDLQLNQISLSNDGNSEKVVLISTGTDPFFILNGTVLLDKLNNQLDRTHMGVVLVLSLLVAFSFYYVGSSVKDILQFVKDFVNNRKLIFNLAKNDFKTKYASSYLGVLWGFINPLLTIATYWFVFQVGLRNGNVGDTPFIIWFIAGIIPWFFFSDALSSSTNSFMDYSYLVKKVVFKIELLPLVKIFSAFFIQVFFVGFIFLIYGAYGHYPTLYSFQLIYYIFCSIFLVVSLSFFTSAVVLFFKDLNQIIAVILQMGFWFTPIGWNVTMLSDFLARLFKLNPMYYIVQGYRDSLIDHILFIDRPYQTVYFWIFCLVMFTFSLKIFKKLRPHFSDVL